MKLPKFNDNAMWWDAWRAFYCEPAPNMVLFKTGDAVLTSAEKYRIAMHGFKPPSVHEVLVDWLRVV